MQNCRGRVAVPRRKAFHNKKEPVFKDFESYENRFFLFTKYDYMCRKIADAIRDGKPVPYRIKAFCDQYARQNNYALRIKHYALIYLLFQFRRDLERDNLFCDRLAVDCQCDFFTCDLVVKDFHYRIEVFYGFAV